MTFPRNIDALCGFGGGAALDAILQIGPQRGGWGITNEAHYRGHSHLLSFVKAIVYVRYYELLRKIKDCLYRVSSIISIVMTNFCQTGGYPCHHPWESAFESSG